MLLFSRAVLAANLWFSGDRIFFSDLRGMEFLSVRNVSFEVI